MVLVDVGMLRQLKVLLVPPLLLGDVVLIRASRTVPLATADLFFVTGNRCFRLEWLRRVRWVSVGWGQHPMFCRCDEKTRTVWGFFSGLL